MKTGFHLHDHTGKAFSNFLKCKESDYIDSCDTSVMSLGKGAGNLRLENVINKSQSLELSKFIFKYYDDYFKKSINPYYSITGRFGITDNYATQADIAKMPIERFIDECKKISEMNLEKDNFSKMILEK